MNKKGFTLIELLAVIVILAIIALIATPVIMNAISNAKQGAWKDAAYGIIKATENVYAKGFSETTDPVDTFFLYENGVMTSYPSGKSIDYKGSVPQDGGIVLHSDGSITMAIHDGSNCAVKTKSSTTVTLSSVDKATCISNIYYKQTTEPFTNMSTNPTFNADSNLDGIADGWGMYIYPTTDGWWSKKVVFPGQYVQRTDLVNSGYLYTTKEFTNAKPNNKYYTYVEFTEKSTNKYSLQLCIDSYTGGAYTHATHANDYTNSSGKMSLIHTTGASTNKIVLFLRLYANAYPAGTGSVVWENSITVDLTSTYGAGNEPTKDQMDNNLNKVWIDSSNNTPKRFTAGGWINF